VFGLDDTTKSVVVLNPNDCIFCKECIYTTEDYIITPGSRFPESKLAVDIKHNPDKFKFTVETTGALTSTEVIRDALKVLSDKLQKLSMHTQKMKMY
jgi:DNA-directed RNA polymerase alpha subunit